MQEAHNYRKQDQLFHMVMHLPCALAAVSEAVQVRFPMCVLPSSCRMCCLDRTPYLTVNKTPSRHQPALPGASIPYQLLPRASMDLTQTADCWFYHLEYTHLFHSCRPF